MLFGKKREAILGTNVAEALGSGYAMIATSQLQLKYAGKNLKVDTTESVVIKFIHWLNGGDIA